MKKHDAVAKVNEALAAGKVYEKAKTDDSVTVEIDGSAATLEFHHDTKHIERRKDEIAKWRAALVEDALSAPAHLKPIAPPAAEPEPVEVEPEPDEA